MKIESAFAPIGNVFLDLVLTALPNRKPWSPEERALWNTSLSELVKKRGMFLIQWMPEIAFAGSTAFLLLPRLIKEKKDVAQP